MLDTEDSRKLLKLLSVYRLTDACKLTKNVKNSSKKCYYKISAKTYTAALQHTRSELISVKVLRKTSNFTIAPGDRALRGAHAQRARVLYVTSN